MTELWLMTLTIEPDLVSVELNRISRSKVISFVSYCRDTFTDKPTADRLFHWPTKLVGKREFYWFGVTERPCRNVAGLRVRHASHAVPVMSYDSGVAVSHWSVVYSAVECRPWSTLLVEQLLYDTRGWTEARGPHESALQTASGSAVFLQGSRTGPTDSQTTLLHL